LPSCSISAARAFRSGRNMRNRQLPALAVCRKFSTPSRLSPDRPSRRLRALRGIRIHGSRGWHAAPRKRSRERSIAGATFTAPPASNAMPRDGSLTTRHCATGGRRIWPSCANGRRAGRSNFCSTAHIGPKRISTLIGTSPMRVSSRAIISLASLCEHWYPAPRRRTRSTGRVFWD
jgi:hypothetical protein